MKSPPDRVGLMVSIPSPGHWIAEIPESLDIPGFLGILQVHIYIYMFTHIQVYYHGCIYVNTIYSPQN